MGKLEGGSRVSGKRLSKSRKGKRVKNIYWPVMLICVFLVFNISNAQTSGDALEFNGTGDYVEIPNVAALNPSTFTYEFWARVDGGAGDYRAPLSTRYWDGTYMYGVNFYADATDKWLLMWGTGTASNTWASLEGPPVQIGTWTHVAATYDGTTMKFYVNGILEADSVSSFTPNSVTPLRFGSIADNLNYFFNGAIDEVRIWNVARSQIQIHSSMHDTVSTTESGLVGYWQFNEGSGTTTHDATSNHDDGTLNFAFTAGDGWIVNTDLPLAVQASGFLAASDAGSVTISWQTISEVSNAGFDILREDPGSSFFKMIASYTSDSGLRGLGTSTTGQNYSFKDEHVMSGESYRYKIQSVSGNGTIKDLSTLSVTVDVPKSYALYQNYPNPFNPSTMIRFDLERQSAVTLYIYNVLGEKVEERNYGIMDAGRYNETLNMDRFASGVYYCRINAVGNDGQRFVSVKKLVLMK